MSEILIKCHDLAKEIEKIKSIDERIDMINNVRAIIHQVSPLKNHPVDFVKWVKSINVEANDYNPNSVAPPEMKLLIKSIDADGYTMPIVTYPENDAIKIVDGFHRSKCERSVKKISDSTFGHIPITSVRKTQYDISNRMASTIRHNRARGSHSIDLMVDIVNDLKKSGMSDNWIMKNIGMDADELLRLKQIGGLVEIFKDQEFSKSFENI